ncbi:MAG: hypothetical protein AAGH53_12200 [Pseudomonadota bacterium]
MAESHDNTHNPGEAKMRKRRRAMYITMVAAGALGFFVGFGTAFFDLGDGNLFAGDADRLILPPVIAIILAIAFLIGLVLWPIYSFRQVDELVERNNLISMSAGWFAMIGAYPIWQVLAAGELVRQPDPFAIFLVGFVITMVTFGIVKFRAR